MQNETPSAPILKNRLTKGHYMLWFWIICSWFVFNTSLPASTPKEVLKKKALHEKQLQRKLNHIFKKKSPNHFFWGVEFYDLTNNKSIYSLNAEKNFLPASNLKLVITAAALNYLKPDYRYKLNAYLTSRHESGSFIYNGDLLIQSNGHPCISSYWLDDEPTLLFKALGDSLLQKNIVMINGDLIGDDGEFQVSDFAMDFRGGDGDYVSTWEFEDMLYAMASPASALSFNENMLDVEVFPAKTIGEPPIVETSLETSFFVILNQASTTASGIEKTLRITRQFGTNNILISGDLPLDARSVSEPIAIEQPALYFLTMLKETLQKKGVAISGSPRRIKPNEAYPDYTLESLATFHSPTLLEILRYINKESNNFSAEQVLRSLGKELTQTASQDSGLSVVNQFLALVHPDENQYRIKDGSGLSRHNLVSPMALLSVLKYMYASSMFEDFRQSLAIGGVDGTLENRFKRSSLQGNIYAKTGYLSSVRTISGYLETSTGKWIGFSLMAMNYTQSTSSIEALQDEALELLKDW